MKQDKRMLSLGVAIILLLVAPNIATVDSLQSNVEQMKYSNQSHKDLIIYYDATSAIPQQFQHLFSANVEGEGLILEYIAITSVEQFQIELQKPATIKYFIFHGSDLGFIIDNEMISWVDFAISANADETKFYAFLSCDSSALDSLLPDKTIMTSEDKIDYKVAYFNSLLYLSDFFYLIENNEILAEKYYSKAMSYFENQAMDLINRFQQPIEALNFNPEDTPQHGMYLAMYEDVRSELGNLDTIARKKGAIGIIGNVLSVYTLFMSTALSAMTVGMGGPAATVFGLLVNHVKDAVEADPNKQPETYATDALNEYAGQLKEKIEDHFISKSVNYFDDKYLQLETSTTGSLMDAVELILDMYSFAKKYSETELNCNAVCAVGATMVYQLLGGQISGVTLSTALDDFIYAMKYNWNDVLTKAKDLKQETKDFLGKLTINVGPIGAIARKMVIELQNSITTFIDTYYDELDQNPKENALIEVSMHHTGGGFFDDYFQMHYTVNNLGGNQAGISYILSSTTTNQGFSGSQSVYDPYFFRPGESYSNSYTVHKHWFTLAHPTQTVTVTVNPTADFRGEKISSKGFSNQYFPQVAKSQLTFSTGSGNTFQYIFVDIDQVADTYWRTFRVIAGGVVKYTKIIGYPGFYGQVSLGGYYTSVTLEIEWGAWKYHGWRMTQMVTY